MGKEKAQQQTTSIIAAIVLPHHDVQTGSAFTVVAQDETEQKQIMLDIAKAVKADVSQLSNGIYLILKD